MPSAQPVEAGSIIQVPLALCNEAWADIAPPEIAPTLLGASVEPDMAELDRAEAAPALASCDGSSNSGTTHAAAAASLSPPLNPSDLVHGEPPCEVRPPSRIKLPPLVVNGAASASTIDVQKLLVIEDNAAPTSSLTDARLKADHEAQAEALPGMMTPSHDREEEEEVDHDIMSLVSARSQPQAVEDLTADTIREEENSISSAAPQASVPPCHRVVETFDL
jgi:hypothetical protein